MPGHSPKQDPRGYRGDLQEFPQPDDCYTWGAGRGAVSAPGGCSKTEEDRGPMSPKTSRNQPRVEGGAGPFQPEPQKQENGNRWGLRGHNTPGSTKWYCPQPDHQVKRKRPVQLNLSYEAMHKKEDAQRKYDPKEIL